MIWGLVLMSKRGQHGLNLSSHLNNQKKKKKKRNIHRNLVFKTLDIRQWRFFSRARMRASGGRLLIKICCISVYQPQKVKIEIKISFIVASKI